MNGRRFI